MAPGSAKMNRSHPPAPPSHLLGCRSVVMECCPGGFDLTLCENHGEIEPVCRNCLKAFPIIGDVIIPGTGDIPLPGSELTSVPLPPQ